MSSCQNSTKEADIECRENGVSPVLLERIYARQSKLLDYYLNEMVKLATDPQLADPNYAHFTHSCYEEVIRKYGRKFTKEQVSPLHGDIKRTDMTEHFRSALVQAGEDFVYCEGFVVTMESNCPFLHAWMYDPKTDKIIDPTLAEEGIAYMGILFNNDYAWSCVVETGSPGIFENSAKMKKPVMADGFPQEAFWKPA